MVQYEKPLSYYGLGTDVWAGAADMVVQQTPVLLHYSYYRSKSCSKGWKVGAGELSTSVISMSQPPSSEASKKKGNNSFRGEKILPCNQVRHL